MGKNMKYLHIYFFLSIRNIGYRTTNSTDKISSVRFGRKLGKRQYHREQLCNGSKIDRSLGATCGRGQARSVHSNVKIIRVRNPSRRALSPSVSHIPSTQPQGFVL
jgi:hypothetical protein